MLRIEVVLTGPSGCGKSRMAEIIRKWVQGYGLADVQMCINGQVVRRDVRGCPSKEFPASIMVIDERNEDRLDAGIRLSGSEPFYREAVDLCESQGLRDPGDDQIDRARRSLVDAFSRGLQVIGGVA